MTSLTPTTDRYASARCRDLDPDLWWTSVPEDIAYAKSICHRCPVLETCRTDGLALEPEARAGSIWGGIRYDPATGGVTR